MTDLVFKAQSFIFFPFFTLAPQINRGYPKYSTLYLHTYYMIQIQTITNNPISISDTILPTVRSINGSISLPNFLISFEGNNMSGQVGLNSQGNYAVRSQLFISCNKSRDTTMILKLMIPNQGHTR
jgi:hypothetical protein